MGRRRRRHGRFCWSCGRDRPNEAFSGGRPGGRPCKRCKRLGPEELEYRQATLDIDRVVDVPGYLRPRDRPRIERFLTHPNERVRNYARRTLDFEDEQRREYLARREEERVMEDVAVAYHEALRGAREAAEAAGYRWFVVGSAEIDSDDIPF